MDKKCETCNNWSPLRTQHCGSCGNCTLMMDHHCPWILNCVGMRNHRAFLLFAVYMALGSVQYFFRTSVYFSYLLYSDDFFQNSLLFYVYWLGISFIIFSFGLMLSGIAVVNFLHAMTNTNTLTDHYGCPWSAENPEENTRITRSF